MDLASVQQKRNKVAEWLKTEQESKGMWRHNTVVAFEETNLTIVIDENDRPAVGSPLMPTLYTPETAQELCRTVKNNNGYHPVPMSLAQYLERTLADLDFTLSLLGSGE